MAALPRCLYFLLSLLKTFVMKDLPPHTDSSLAVWVVEDDAEYRQTIVYILNHTSDLHCTAEFCAFEEVQALIEDATFAAAPDVVLMDIGLPGVNGIDGVSRLKARMPHVPIVMLTLSDEPDTIFDALRAGASGYLLKDTPRDQTLAAVREAYRGGTLMPASIASKILRFFTRATPQQDYKLTKREKEVLGLMTQGYAQKQIADMLRLSPHTVDNHIRHIYAKLHVHSGTEAVSKAIREHLI